MPKCIILHRVRKDGEVYDMVPANLWDARRNVAWCLEDNAGLSRTEAVLVGDQLTLGEPLVSYGYSWTLR